MIVHKKKYKRFYTVLLNLMSTLGILFCITPWINWTRAVNTNIFKLSLIYNATFPLGLHKAIYVQSCHVYILTTM